MVLKFFNNINILHQCIIYVFHVQSDIVSVISMQFSREKCVGVIKCDYQTIIALFVVKQIISCAARALHGS